MRRWPHESCLIIPKLSTLRAGPDGALQYKRLLERENLDDRRHVARWVQSKVWIRRIPASPLRFALRAGSTSIYHHHHRHRHHRWPRMSGCRDDVDGLGMIGESMMFQGG